MNDLIWTRRGFVYISLQTQHFTIFWGKFKSNGDTAMSIHIYYNPVYPD
jgi:hypothetical protein